MQTQSKTSSNGYNLSRQALAALMHDHGHIKTMDHATLFKTGELDIELLHIAQLSVEADVLRSPVVSVEVAAFTRNFVTLRDEPVFATRTSDGTFCGHYFAGAFKGLTM